jgi:hypothetical protein
METGNAKQYDPWPFGEEVTQNEKTEDSGMPLFSFFRAPVQNTIPWCTVNLPFVYDLIRGDTYAEVTRMLREISDPFRVRIFKAQSFDFMTPSGIFAKREAKYLLRHSGLIVFDFDHVDDLNGLKATLLADSCLDTALLYTSPSGKGLKWLASVDLKLATHEEYFKAIQNYLELSYGIKADASGKDIARCCFLSYDPEVFIHPKYLS